MNQRNKDNELLIKGGQVYRHYHNTDSPNRQDILIRGGKIVSIANSRTTEMPLELGVDLQNARIIDARDCIVLPGFVNAHYHSHDTLQKGCFETIPLEFWSMYAMPPLYPRRSKEELRVRTLIGAVECLLSGMTRVQDMSALYPFRDDDLDTVLSVYDEIGLRCQFAPQFSDIPKLDARPFWRDMVPAQDAHRLAAPEPPFMAGADIVGEVAEAVRQRQGRYRLVDFALGPSCAEMVTSSMLEATVEAANRLEVPIYTHIYENKAMTLIGRQRFEAYGGSLVRYLDAHGALGPRTGLAHSVWLIRDEIELLAARQANVIVNPVGNLKTRSGIPPVRELLEAGVNTAIGCDNCSCSDSQNMFQALKLFCGFPAISDHEPGTPTAAAALMAATLGGARTLGHDFAGAIEIGMDADLTLIDATDVSYVPLNSVARQVVFTEGGRGVHSVIVDGEVVVDNRKITRIDEAALADEVGRVMPDLIRDMQDIIDRVGPIEAILMEAHRRTAAAPLDVDRFVPRLP